MDILPTDYFEILSLPARYGNAIDDRDWPALHTIFTEDAVFDSPSIKVRMDGLAAIIDFMDTTDLHPLAHFMVNVVIEPKDDRVFMRFRGLFPVANSDGVPSPSLVFHGYYFDELIRTKEGWRVKNRVFTVEPRDRRVTNPSETNLE